METTIYTGFGPSHVELFCGKIDMVVDKGNCIRFVSPWPKKFEKLPCAPMLHISVKVGTMIKVLEDQTDDPTIWLLGEPESDTDKAIADNMRDYWAHKAAFSEGG